jgi:hypothetical protein
MCNINYSLNYFNVNFVPLLEHMPCHIMLEMPLDRVGSLVKQDTLYTIPYTAPGK